MILPTGYVVESVELGYACTIHGAQGVTADVLHGIATGAETRQQLYTMLTRGRHANHVHLEVVGDGDAHSLIRPEAIIPPTATDILERILARDEDNTSATTTARTLADPATGSRTPSPATATPSATQPNRPQAPTSAAASNRPPTSSSPDSPTLPRGPRSAPTCS